MLRVVALALALSAGQVHYPAAISAPSASAAETPLRTPRPSQAESTVTVETAQQLLTNGDYGSALAAAEQLVARDPFNVEAHHVIQLVYRRQRDYTALMDRYRTMAERYPGSAAAQYLLGNAILSAPDVRGANAYFDRALELDPRFGWAASINAIYAQMAGNPEEAIRLGRISAEAIMSDLGIAAIYADILRLNGLRDEALRHLQTAAALNPQEPRYLLELWKMWVRGVEDYEGARAQFAADVAANRGRFLATPELAAEYARFLSGAAWANTDDSRRAWLALADRFPEAPGAKDALLRGAGYTDDVDERIGIYNRILEGYPESPVRYTVYKRIIELLIREEEYDRAQRTARGLISEPDPGRGPGDQLGPNEGATQWGYTFEGIGYAGWFAAAQAELGVRDVGRYSVRVGSERRRDQPISPEALTAARAMLSSGCSDPRALEYVGRIVLNSEVHRELGIRLVERAMGAAEGSVPLMEIAYGAAELEDARSSLERLWRDMPYFYAEAGMLPEAERAVDELLAAAARDGNDRVRGDTHFLAGYVFERVGRYREAARHYLIGMWFRTASPADFEDGLGNLYRRIADDRIHRFASGSGPAVPLAASGIVPAGDQPLDGERLGGDLLLVHFWGLWSERSLAQLALLNEMAPALEASGVSVLAIAVQDHAGVFVRDNGRTVFRRMLETEYSADLPLARAEIETIDRLELVGLPTTMLLDANGRILARQLGYDVEPGTWGMAWRDLIDEELARLRQARNDARH